MQGLRPLFRYFDFAGRSGRAEYWQFFALTFIISMLLSLMEFRSLLASAALGVPSIPIWSTVFSLLVFIPATAAMFRRLHDRNKSGWLVGGFWIFMGMTFVVLIIGMATSETAGESAIGPLLLAIGLVLMIVSIYILVQLALPGDDFENDYGWPDNAPFDVQDAFGGRKAVSHARPPTQRVSTRHPEDALVRIERLADLHAKGHLTNEEFVSQKTRLLDGIA
jgi:uncharacterized membrane protein YhaH (DUF805 family)